MHKVFLLLRLLVSYESAILHVILPVFPLCPAEVFIWSKCLTSLGLVLDCTTSCDNWHMS